MADDVFDVARLARAIDAASEDIKRQIVGMLRDAATTTQHRVQDAYPVGPTGRLRGSVYVTQPRSFSSSAYGLPIPVLLVRASAPHVHIYQEGTKPRVDATRGNAYRGISPKHGKIFERIAATVRGQFLRDAQAVLDRPKELV